MPLNLFVYTVTSTVGELNNDRRTTKMGRIACELSFAKYWLLFFNLFFAVSLQCVQLRIDSNEWALLFVFLVSRSVVVDFRNLSLCQNKGVCWWFWWWLLVFDSWSFIVHRRHYLRSRILRLLRGCERKLVHDAYREYSSLPVGHPIANHGLWFQFAILLIVIVVLEMTVATIGMVNRKTMHETLSEHLIKSLHDYENYKRPWEWLQTEVIL